ncbi:MAG: arginase family protein [Polyangiaceae bacterium]|nr:arginase family protein [Polyangiaceae bacterium]
MFPPPLLETVSLLCAPPGAGWAASSSGYAPLAHALHERLYGTAVPADVRARWLAEFGRVGCISAAVLGVPYDGGTYGLRGAAAGPLGIRVAASRAATPLFGTSVVDLGDVPQFPALPLDEQLAPELLARARKARYGVPHHDLPVAMLSVHQHLVRACAAAGVPLLTLGGDHSVAASALAGREASRIALLHIDAHSDLSQGRDGLSLLHSSWIHHSDVTAPLSALVQVGVPDDAPAPAWIAPRLTRLSTLTVHTNPVDAARRVLDAVAASAATAVYVSVDIDALHVSEAPATGLPADDGLRSDVVVAFLEAVGAGCRVIGADLSEVAPPLAGTRMWDDDVTCATAMRLAAVLLGLLAQGRPCGGARQDIRWGDGR